VKTLWNWICAFFNWLHDRTVGIVEILGTALAVVVVVWWVQYPPVRFVPQSAFAVLATLPGLIAIAYHCISALPRFQARREATRDYDRFTEGFDRWWVAQGWQRKLAQTGYAPAAKIEFSTSKRGCTTDDYLSFRPMLSGTLWGALLLSLVFLLAVGVAHDPTLLIGKATKDPGLYGFLFAALGAYVSVMWRMINRIHANALSYRFIFTATLRTAVAMSIGYVSDRVDLFAVAKGSPATYALFFFIGLFTDWALSELRTRARTVFNQPNAACDRLPLCLVDGLDDGMIDILDELGIWDVEHLATSEPAELTIRTLYPFNRVIDWIDQAILIIYLRRNIGIAREHGVTGAIDLSVLYSYTLQGEPPTSVIRANRTLDEMAKKMSMSRDVLDGICQTLYFDYTVEQLYRFWQRHRIDPPDDLKGVGKPPPDGPPKTTA
jgi:hypothetical protein